MPILPVLRSLHGSHGGSLHNPKSTTNEFDRVANFMRRLVATPHSEIKVQLDTITELENLLINVPLQVRRFNRNVGSVQSALDPSSKNNSGTILNH
jgi:hypothetical protein